MITHYLPGTRHQNLSPNCMDDERQDCWQKEKTHEELKTETKGIRYHHFTSWWFQPTGKIPRTSFRQEFLLILTKGAFRRTSATLHFGTISSALLEKHQQKLIYIGTFVFEVLGHSYLFHLDPTWLKNFWSSADALMDLKARPPQPFFCTFWSRCVCDFA